MESVCWSVEVDFGNFRILEKETSFGFEGRIGAFPCHVTGVSKRPRYLLVAYLRIPPTLYDATSPGVSQRGGYFLQAPRYQFE